MKNSTVKEIIIPAISLFLICLVATALLGFTNQITAPKIEQLAIETENNAKKEVLSDAADFSDKMTATLDEAEYSYYEGLDGDKNVIGYVFTVNVLAH